MAETPFRPINAHAGNDPNIPLTGVIFDPHHELLWTGNENGFISSFYGTRLERYSSYRAHHGPVRQLMVLDRGIVSIGKDSIHMSNRRGMASWDLSDESTEDLHSMALMGNAEIVVAGQQSKIVSINLIRGSVMKKVDTDSEIIVMKKSRLLVCGSTQGDLILHDPRTLSVEHRIQAHTGTISDLDVSGNLIVTCGFSERQGNLIIDPLVKVYDMRTMRSLAPIPFPNGPSFLKMHPKLSTTVCIASQTGQFQMCDVGSSSTGIQFYQANTSSYVTGFDISYSGEMIALGDASNVVHIWGDKDEPRMNHFSNQIDTPSLPTTPSVMVNDNDPLASVGMPYYTEQLLSAWPSNTIFPIGRKPQPIPAAILDNMKMIDFVGYAPNPNTRLRNQAPSLPKVTMRDTPKFRSEQQKELYFGKGKRKGSNAPAWDNETDVDLTSGVMPKYYGRVEIKYSKFGIEDFDFGFYNKTIFGGLETHIANSYCNALLQVLFFTPLLRNLAKAHIGQTCPRENCVTCELGFLFRMLEDANGQNCQARNFLRAFSTIPQASALGLFEPEEPDAKTPYSSLIQNFNRFVLEQLHQECSLDRTPLSLPTNVVNSNQPSPIQQIFGMKMASISVCNHCQLEEERVTYPFVVDLAWGKQGNNDGGRNNNSGGHHHHHSNSSSNSHHHHHHSNSKSGLQQVPQSFAEILKTSISREAVNRVWCTRCQAYQPTTGRKTLLDLPQVLSINTGIAPKDITAAPPGTLMDDNGHGAGWLPMRFTMSIKEKLMVVVDDSLKDAGDDDGNDEETAVYELTSVVSQIQPAGEVGHLVSHIKVLQDSQQQQDSSSTGEDDEEPSSQASWFIFNDFLVKPVLDEEVTQFPSAWKVPSVLYYTKVVKGSKGGKTLATAVPVEPMEPDTKILQLDLSVSKYRDPNYVFYQLLRPDEIQRGEPIMIAIDTEFVTLSREETEIRSDGTKSLLRPRRMSLARVSVLRGDDGPMEYVPFIDDYIATSEPVVDYLTEFSGIQPGDLDPNLSKHTVVPLKVAYKRLRVLVDMGCIFVGHGLRQDFRIINILVPPEQVKDTVDIFHIKNRQRKISLRFLAWYVLHEDIQAETHDSIEDARTALAIYKKYLEMEQQGIFEDVLEDIYNEGRKTNWKPVPGQFPTGIMTGNAVPATGASPFKTGAGANKSGASTPMLSSGSGGQFAATLSRPSTPGSGTGAVISTPPGPGSATATAANTALLSRDLMQQQQQLQHQQQQQQQQHQQQQQQMQMQMAAAQQQAQQQHQKQVAQQLHLQQQQQQQHLQQQQLQQIHPHQQQQQDVGGGGGHVFHPYPPPQQYGSQVQLGPPYQMPHRQQQQLQQQLQQQQQQLQQQQQQQQQLFSPQQHGYGPLPPNFVSTPSGVVGGASTFGLSPAQQMYQQAQQAAAAAAAAAAQQQQQQQFQGQQQQQFQGQQQQQPPFRSSQFPPYHNS